MTDHPPEPTPQKRAAETRRAQKATDQEAQHQKTRQRSEAAGRGWMGRRSREHDMGGDTGGDET